MMNEPIEVELKVPLESPDQIRQQLKRLDALELNSEIQHDDYFDHPCRSFATSDEALRVRTRESISGIEANFAVQELTYKGPKLDAVSKTRVELSTDLTETTNILAMLDHLGFTHVARITKRRTFYRLDKVIVSLDDVDDLGWFLELEVIVDSKDDVTSTLDQLFSIIQELGIDPKSSIRESYLELYLDQVA
jgi:adenylate cyclase class 2